MGPVSLRPTAGSGWTPRKRPERLRATFNRRHGVRYVFGAYDVHGDRLRVRLRARRRGSDNPAFLKQIRDSYPRRLRIYWIQDNLSANGTADIRNYAAANNIELVPTPTYASYLNRVECHFLPISSSSSRTPTTQAGTPSRTHPPATSPTATPPTATNDSSNSNADTSSPPNHAIPGQHFRDTPLVLVMMLAAFGAGVPATWGLVRPLAATPLGSIGLWIVAVLAGASLGVVAVGPVAS